MLLDMFKPVPPLKPRQRLDAFKFKRSWDKKDDWPTRGRLAGDGGWRGKVQVPPSPGRQAQEPANRPRLRAGCEVPVAPPPAMGSTVGLDLGTTWVAVTPDGEFIESPRHLGSSLKKLRVQHRAVIRLKRGATGARWLFSRWPKPNTGSGGKASTSTTRSLGGWSTNTTSSRAKPFRWATWPRATSPALSPTRAGPGSCLTLLQG